MYDGGMSESKTEVVQFTMKMTREARDQLGDIARSRGLTATAYLQAAVGVEQWTHSLRNNRVLVERSSGTVEVLLPFAGVFASSEFLNDLSIQ
jgi:hypothetical protein